MATVAISGLSISGTTGAVSATRSLSLAGASVTSIQGRASAMMRISEIEWLIVSKTSNSVIRESKSSTVIVEDTL